MEHTDRIVVIPSNMGWSDVGSWNVLEELRDPDKANTEYGSVIALDSRDNVLYADTDALIAAVGVEGMVVAASGNMVLVCPKGKAQEVRRVVEELQKRGWGRHL
jgi:mannose-1-phosphate guanylyltransferase